MAEKPVRLTPKPNVLRQLYVLSGNNCAMPKCKGVILDNSGVMVGQVCHIEAALPDGARFNPAMTNEQRRAISNLVLMCGSHHPHIDSKANEAKYTTLKVQKIKVDHEAKFKGIDATLQKGFESAFTDSTESLNPTQPTALASITHATDYTLDDEEVPKAIKDLHRYLNRMDHVPEDSRDFMLAVLKRARRINCRFEHMTVNADDLSSALQISGAKIKRLAAALEEYHVGCLTEIPVGERDSWHVQIYNPSTYLSWACIFDFCDAAGHGIEDFVLHLKFGLLG